MQITNKEFKFLFAWIVILSFGTLALREIPVYEKFLYLFVSIICELWIIFRMPGSKSLWIFSKNADNSKYKEIRLLCFLLLWFLMLALPKGFDLFIYYLFVLFFERLVAFYSLSKKKREAFFCKTFPLYKKYGNSFFIAMATAFLFILLFSFRIGENFAICFR